MPREYEYASNRKLASQSHRDNEKYMDKFEKGFQEMQVYSAATTPQRNAASKKADIASMKNQIPTSNQASTIWSKGPIDASGSLVTISPQNVTCMSTQGKFSVMGSTDHALYVVDLNSKKNVKTLYSKRCGHAEWVTCVDHLPDGRVVSGAMDSKLCVWSSSGHGKPPQPNCKDLIGHFGSISKVIGVDDQHIISASYDKTLRLWQSRNAKLPFTEALVFQGHKSPILDATYDSSKLLSGDRDGSAILWDAKTAQIVRKWKAHRGHTTKVALWDNTNLIVTGGQDGCVRIWDEREAKSVCTIACHASANGTGAICELGKSGNAIVSAGADTNLNIIDIRSNFSVKHTLTEHDTFIYSMYICDNTIFSGSGSGALHVHDLETGKLEYALGANTAAVRCINTVKDTLIAAGDDGSCLLYSF